MFNPIYFNYDKIKSFEILTKRKLESNKPELCIRRNPNRLYQFSASENWYRTEFYFLQDLQNRITKNYMHGGYLEHILKNERL